LAGLISDFDVEALALLASHYLGSDGASAVDAEQVKKRALSSGKTDSQVAQVYATLALVEAVRELTHELKNPATRPIGEGR
jgi:nitrogen-specific signal transduction histidine kinase